MIEMLSVQVALADAGHERIRALAEWRSARLRMLTSAGRLGGNDIGMGKQADASSPSRN